MTGFLAHLSTKCSWWAIVIVLCPSSVVRCPLSTFYLAYALEATFSVQSSWNLVRMFVSIKSRTSSKLGHVGSKTRSLVQILEKPCVCSRGHIFSPILMKLGQNVCLDEISDKFEIGSCGVISVRSSWNLVRMFVWIKSQTSANLGHVGSKTRSLGQILEKPFVHYRGHIFSAILLKNGQNVCLDYILK